MTMSKRLFQGKFVHVSDLPAQAGFVGARGKYQTLITSGTESIVNITRLSNINRPGVFVFRISDKMPVDPREIGKRGECFSSSSCLLTKQHVMSEE